MKAKYLLGLCLIIVQSWAMEVEKDLTLPTDFYHEVLADFVEQHCSGDTTNQDALKQFLTRIKAHELSCLDVEFIKPCTIRPLYIDLVCQLARSSLRKAEKCYIAEEKLNEWEINWCLEKLSKEAYQEKFLLHKSIRTLCKNLDDVLYGDYADYCCTRISAMKKAEQKAHEIMLSLLR
jgi:hypothetical protein